MTSPLTRTIVLLAPGTFLIVLGLYAYRGDGELSEVYGTMTIVAGILVALGGVLFALPSRRR
jgi:hypothetical protein